MPAHIDRHLSPRQQDIARVILHLGGYWPPIFGVARLLEELGEYAEGMSSIEAQSINQISEELADIAIISTCIANQYCITLPENALDHERAGHFTARDLLVQLLIKAGLVARAVNYYNGPKIPSAFEGWIPLGDTLRAFQADLANLADICSVDLNGAVQAKLKEITIRDQGRFEPSFDPSTAASLREFQSVIDVTACTFAGRARLWGGPEWNPALSIPENASIVAPYLVSFTRCSEPENIDSFVLKADGPFAAKDMATLSRSFHQLLRALTFEDPADNLSLRVQIERPGWQFTFNRTRLFLTVFSELYDTSSPRYSPSGTFIVFQPETSFNHCSIGSAFPESPAIKTRIRDEFIKRNFVYPSELIDQRIEARLYLLPRYPGDQESEWWRYG